jgi:uncharacterized protein (DUF1330 family)
MTGSVITVDGGHTVSGSWGLTKCHQRAGRAYLNVVEDVVLLPRLIVKADKKRAVCFLIKILPNVEIRAIECRNWRDVMPKCYLVANVTITDPGPYVEYQQKVPAIVARHGGKYLARAGTMHPLEGDLGIERMVIVEFESMDTARRFYESAEYAPLLKLRKETTRSQVALVEGYATA